jgi:hypothetical protein
MQLIADATPFPARPGHSVASYWCSFAVLMAKYRTCGRLNKQTKIWGVAEAKGVMACNSKRHFVLG